MRHNNRLTDLYSGIGTENTKREDYLVLRKFFRMGKRPQDTSGRKARVESNNSTVSNEAAYHDAKRAIEFLQVGDTERAIRLGVNAARWCRSHRTKLYLTKKLGLKDPGRDPTSYPIEPTPERLAKLHKMNARNGLSQDDATLRRQLADGVKPEGYSEAELEIRLEWQAAVSILEFAKAIDSGNERKVVYASDTGAFHFARLQKACQWIVKAQTLPDPAYHISDLAKILGLNNAESNTKERKRLAFILERAGWDYVRDGRRKVWRKPEKE